MNQAPLTLEAPPIATSTLNRRLVAIAFADVASFSRLMALSEVETVRRWKALRTQIMEPHMLRHGGRLVDLAGDGMLVEFSSAVNAVRWAADVQRVQHSALSDSDRFAMHLRIGIRA
jgi:adenylate cyclase